MTWDLGIGGLAVLAGLALGFGLAGQALVGRFTTRWLWLVAGVGAFLGGIVASEVVFGWATAAELQPNIDGLSFDEALLGGLVTGAVAVVATWMIERGSHAGHQVA
jgi:hypothetical protein